MVLVFSNGTRIVVQPDTEFVVERLEQASFNQSRLGTFLRLKVDPSKSVIVLRLLRGTLEGQAWNLHAGSQLKFVTDAGEVSVRGGFFHVSALSTGDGGADMVVTASCATGAMDFAPLDSHAIHIPAGTELDATGRKISVGAIIELQRDYGLPAVRVSRLRCYYPRSKDLIIRVVRELNETISDYNANPYMSFPEFVIPETPPCPLKDISPANGPMPYPR